MAGAITSLGRAALKTGAGKALAAGAEKLAQKAVQRVAPELSQALSKGTTTVAERFGLLAEALPTGQLSVGAKQLESFEKMLKLLGKSDDGIIGFLKGLLSKGSGRTVTVTSKEAASGVGKDLALAVTEGGNQVAKLETSSAFIGEIGEALSKAETDMIAKKLAAVEKDLTPEALEKLSNGKLAEYISAKKLAAVEKDLTPEALEKLSKTMNSKAWLAEHISAKDLKAVFPDCSEEFLTKIATKLNGYDKVAKYIKPIQQTATTATKQFQQVTKNSVSSETFTKLVEKGVSKKAAEEILAEVSKFKAGLSPDDIDKLANLAKKHQIGIKMLDEILPGLSDDALKNIAKEFGSFTIVK